MIITDVKALSTVMIAAKTTLDNLCSTVDAQSAYLAHLESKSGTSGEAQQKLTERHIAVASRELQQTMARRDELSSALAVLDGERGL